VASFRKSGGTRQRTRSFIESWQRSLQSLPKWQQVLWISACVLPIFCILFFVYSYVHFSDLIDSHLNGDVYNNPSIVFSAPEEIRLGEAITARDVAERLRKAHYASGGSDSGIGEYRLRSDKLEIRPGPASFFEGGPIQEGAALVTFQDGKVSAISALEGGGQLQNYYLEPQVLTTLFDKSRSKRLLVGYADLPKSLVDAVLAAEDHRFFSHQGVDFYRIVGAAVADLRTDERAQGGSTLTMQLARSPLFLNTRRRTLRRKMEEICLALLMEQRLTKQQIFEFYANQIYLGQHGSFSIYGFGEAADVYFHKDVKSLTLPESALLAAIIRGPNLYSPFTNPNRARARRNLVLRRMADNSYITADQAQQAAETPIRLSPHSLGGEAPYFVDMVKDQLLSQYSERDLISQSFRVYTSLDPELQQVAAEAVKEGSAELDKVLSGAKRSKDTPPPEPNQPQIAMVVLDPHSGEIKALVGGRNYTASQLNHALARRQPGSVFKPFVYAAALNSAVDAGGQRVTTVTQLQDEKTTFHYGDKTYEPGNYKQQYMGTVTVRDAFAHSLNVATVSLGQMIGFNRVRNLALECGLNHDMQATPAIALGAYVATPLEMAGAYTVFANGGEYVSPRSILQVNDASGHAVMRTTVTRRRVLDPRVDYLMVSLMQSVINYGTGYAVRQRGFSLPAAGKTGTSHDGWFAGFTSNLLAVVWVGYDDDRDLNLSGSQSALPVWTEFMKKAAALSAYRTVHDFSVPSGIVSVDMSPSPDSTADPVRHEVFIEGTQPETAQGPEALPSEGRSGVSNLLHKIIHLGGETKSEAEKTAPATNSPGAVAGSSLPAATAGGASPDPEPPPAKKPGKWHRFWSSINGRGDNEDAPARDVHPPAQQENNQ
jgi:penicillin-binding protein 1B